MRWVGRGDIGDVQGGWRIVERIDLLFRRGICLLGGRFLRESWAVAQLELPVCKFGVCYIDGTLTGMPVEVRMIASSVCEKRRLELAFAALNLASTRPGSPSDRPRSILIGRGMAMAVEGVRLQFRIMLARHRP